MNRRASKKMSGLMVLVGVLVLVTAGLGLGEITVGEVEGIAVGRGVQGSGVGGVEGRVGTNRSAIVAVAFGGDATVPS